MEPKYIAAGFMTDANKLINEFIDQKSLDFKTFSNLWKKNKFSYVLMGRPHIKEFTEFVNEIYQLVLNNMIESSIQYKIGGMYLLYALYRSQTAVAPIMIRVTQSQFENFKSVQSFAKTNNITTLLYVMGYLFENCLELTACAVLCGPCHANTKVSYMKPKPTESGLLKTLKTDLLNLYENNILQDVRDLHCHYLNQRESIQQNESSAPREVSNKYKEFIGGLSSLVGDKNYPTHNTEFSSENIGNRRRQLKTTSFETKAYFRQLNPDETQEIPQPSSKKTIKRRRRVPPDQRRAGRPRKKEESEEDLDESAITIMNEAVASTSSTTRRRTTRRNVSYLVESEDESLVNSHLQVTTPVSDGDYISDTSEDYQSLDELRF